MELDASIINLVAEKLDARTLARCECVCREWRDVCKREAFWEELSRSEFGLNEMNGYGLARSDKQQITTWKTLYSSLISRFLGLDLQHTDCVVAIKFWLTVHRWAYRYCPELLQTLDDGLHPNILKSSREKLECSIPGVIQALYVIHDGQRVFSRPEDTPPVDDTESVALFGRDSRGISNYMQSFKMATLGLYGYQQISRKKMLPAFGRVLPLAIGENDDFKFSEDWDTPIHPEDLYARLQHGNFFTLSRPAVEYCQDGFIIDVANCIAADESKFEELGPKSYRRTDNLLSKLLPLLSMAGEAEAAVHFGHSDSPSLCAWLSHLTELFQNGGVRAFREDFMSADQETSPDGADQKLSDSIPQHHQYVV